jgi:hypothetical protein
MLARQTLYNLSHSTSPKDRKGPVIKQSLHHHLKIAMPCTIMVPVETKWRDRTSSYRGLKVKLDFCVHQAVKSWPNSIREN